MHKDKNASGSKKSGRATHYPDSETAKEQLERKLAPDRRQHLPSSISKQVDTEKQKQLTTTTAVIIEPLFVERRRSQRWLASRLLRMKEVAAICGLSSSAIYKYVRSGTFPQPIKIGLRASAWIKTEVEAWIEQRISASRR